LSFKLRWNQLSEVRERTEVDKLRYVGRPVWARTQFGHCDDVFTLFRGQAIKPDFEKTMVLTCEVRRMVKMYIVRDLDMLRLS